MRIDDIKNKILTLAIQGKLVPQNKGDEPAAVLLEKIKAEKEQLIKEKKIKKEKPLPEIGEEEKVFEIPEGWEWCRLGDVSILKSGGQYEIAENISNSIPYVKVSDMNNKENLIEIKTSEQFVDVENINNNVIIPTQSIIFPKRGGAILTNKKRLVLKNDILVDSNTMAIIPSKIINLFYIKIWFDSTNLGGLTSGTSVPQINNKDINPLIVPLPPLEEQHRIVSKVEELFKIVEELGENKEAMLKNIAATRNKVLQLAIQGKLTEQEEGDEPASVLLEKIQKEKEQLIKEKKIKKEKPLPEILEEEKGFEIPKGWEWCRLGEIGSYKKGPFGSAITKSMFVSKSEDTVKVYEQKNAIQKDWTLGEYYVTREYFESKLKGFEVFEGDIIVSCAGTIGETYIMPNGIEKGVINQALMKMNIFDGVNINYFLMYFECILKEAAKDSSKGSAIKNIPPFDIFKKMLFALPPLSEQHRIVSKVDELMEYLNQLEKTILAEEII